MKYDLIPQESSVNFADLYAHNLPSETAAQAMARALRDQSLAFVEYVAASDAWNRPFTQTGWGIPRKFGPAAAETVRLRAAREQLDSANSYAAATLAKYGDRP